MKKIFFAVLLSLLLAIVSSAIDVRVSLPDFPIEINEFDRNYNVKEEYPMLVYKNITYFPLTYNNAQLINLNYEWTEEDGLVLSNADSDVPKEFYCEQIVLEKGIIPIPGGYTTDADIFTVYNLLEDNKKNNNNLVATVATEKVSFDGMYIDNSSLEYPILSFRNIVYIPLTYDFVTEYLKGTVTFDSENGLFVCVNNYFYNPENALLATYDENGAQIEWDSFRCTYYIKDNLTVHLKTTNFDLGGPLGSNIKVSENGVEKIVWNGWFGYYMGKAPQFMVKDGKIYTVYCTMWDEIRDGIVYPCIIDIESCEIEKQ